MVVAYPGRGADNLRFTRLGRRSGDGTDSTEEAL
jgi:hypothetical protein